MYEEEKAAILEHYGVKGMKWGQRKARPDSLSVRKADKAATKGVKGDYNNLSDKAFFQKHGVTKGRYAKRVEKSGGDPLTTKTAARAKKLDESRFGQAAKANINRSSARSRNRQLNKESRARDKATEKQRVAAAKEKHKNDVDTARAAVKSGQTKEQWKAAKAEARARKTEIGSREARKIRKEARNVRWDTVAKSREIRDGKEFTTKLLADVMLGTQFTANTRTWRDTYDDMYNPRTPKSLSTTR